MNVTRQAISPTPLSGGANAPGPSTEDRLETIFRLQRQAIYPMDTVGAVRAQAQLAQVEVPWLTKTLQDAIARISELERLVLDPAERLGPERIDARVRAA